MTNRDALNLVIAGPVTDAHATNGWKWPMFMVGYLFGMPDGDWAFSDSRPSRERNPEREDPAPLTLDLGSRRTQCMLNH